MSDTTKPKRRPKATTGAPPKPTFGPIVTDPNLELVAYSDAFRYISAPRSLPHSIDDIEEREAVGIYRKMAHDATLAGVTTLCKIRAMRGGGSVVPSHKAPDETKGDDPEGKALFETAQKFADEMTYSLKRLERSRRSIVDILWEMLDCIGDGHKLAEVNTEIETGGDYDGLRVLRSIKPKPRENYTMLVDPFGNFLGVLAAVPGVSPVMQTGPIWDPSTISNAIAPDKLFILRVGGKNDDPRGESLYRSAYDPWYRYQLMKPEMVKTAIQFGGGMIIIELDKESATEVDGSDVRVLLANAAASLRNGGVMVGTPGAKIMPHAPKSDPAFFDSYARLCKEEMAMSVIISARAVMEAEHGSKADAGQAENVVDEVVSWLQELICNAVKAQIFYPLMIANHGKEIADKFCPGFALGASISPDFAANALGLAAIGYALDPSQIVGIEREFKIPPRRSDWQEVAAKDQPQPETGQSPIRFKRGGRPMPEKAAPAANP